VNILSAAALKYPDKSYRRDLARQSRNQKMRRYLTTKSAKITKKNGGRVFQPALDDVKHFARAAKVLKHSGTLHAEVASTKSTTQVGFLSFLLSLRLLAALTITNALHPLRVPSASVVNEGA
jgi:hypothetical protein